MHNGGVHLKIIVFKNQLFLAFYRFFCKNTNLGDIDLKFSGSLSDVNRDNHAKFCEVKVKCLEVISQNRVFRDFGL